MIEVWGCRIRQYNIENIGDKTMFAKGRDNNAKISAKKNFGAETPLDCQNN